MLHLVACADYIGRSVVAALPPEVGRRRNEVDRK